MKPQMLILIGPSGSGKTTFRDKFTQFNPNYIVLCPDIMRGVVGQDESDQTVNNIVFSNIKNMAVYFAKMGWNLIIDATNYNRKNRAMFLKIAKEYGYNIVGITFAADVNTCLLRNETREKRVPIDVIHRMFDNYEKPTLDEGFDNIIDSEDFLDNQGINSVMTRINAKIKEFGCEEDPVIP